MRLNLGLVFLLILQDAQPLLFDVLELSGVITAQVADKDWTTIQNTPGVASVEEDQTFTAI